MKFHVASKDDQCGDLVLWWKPDRAGYTTDVDQAGVYEDESEFPEEHYILLNVEAVPMLFTKVITIDAIRRALREQKPGVIHCGPRR